jgi:hypothetical protein
MNTYQKLKDVRLEKRNAIKQQKFEDCARYRDMERFLEEEIIKQKKLRKEKLKRILK